MLTRISSEQYNSIYKHSKWIYGSPTLLVMERVVKFKKKKKNFSSKGSTEAKARTVSKKALKTPGNQADNLLSV